MKQVHLNYINSSDAPQPPDIVIFQESGGGSDAPNPIVWKVIRYCKRGWNHPFVFDYQYTGNITDGWGNYSPMLTMELGKSYKAIEEATGMVFKLAGDAGDPNSIDVLNALPEDAIDANVHNAGKLTASRRLLLPQMWAEFRLEPKIRIGAMASAPQAGSGIPKEVAEMLDTELNLAGLESADIVMTGGGPGKDAEPFAFRLENTVFG